MQAVKFKHYEEKSMYRLRHHRSGHGGCLWNVDSKKQR